MTKQEFVDWFFEQKPYWPTPPECYDKIVNSLAGEQQPVTGEAKDLIDKLKQSDHFLMGDGYSMNGEIRSTIKEVINFLASQPPTPEPAGELYRWRYFDESDKSTWPPSKKGCFVRWLEDGREIIGGCHIFDWFNDNKFDVSDDDDIDPKNPRGAQPHQWLEKVEPQQNQDE